MSRTLKIVAILLVSLLLLGLVGIFVVSQMRSSDETAAPVDALSQQKAACDVLKASNPAIVFDTFGCHLPKPEPVVRTERVTDVVTLPCTATTVLTDEVIPAPVPTEEPAPVAPAPEPTCPFENGWSKQDDYPMDNGHVPGSDIFHTYGQYWIPSLGVDTTFTFDLAPGLQIEFADPDAWKGTTYFTCAPEMARKEEMRYEVQGINSLSFLPALHVITSEQDWNAAGYRVVRYNGPVGTFGTADYSPLAMDQFASPVGGDLPMGDAQLWQYAQTWDNVNANTAFHFAVAPGLIVRVPGGWVGAESKFDTRDEVEWQRLLAEANADGLSRQLIIVDDLSDASLLPAGFSVQVFPN